MIRQIAVIGTGTMGRGIAYLSAVAGYDTILHDVDASALDAARASIESMLKKGVEKGKVDDSAARSAMQRIQVMTELEPAVRTADLIIEAVPEDLDLKKNLFSQADVICGEETILASNTSSFSITTLAGSVERRGQFVGMHFFNPPHAMKLIEIVRGERTSDRTIEQAREVAEKMGKLPIVVRDSRASPRRAWESPSDWKRCACSRTASHRPRISIARWSSGTTIRWAPCASPTSSASTSASASPSIWRRRSARASSRRRFCGAWCARES